MSVTAPLGFEAAGVSCGIKHDGAPDLALLVGAEGTIGAGVFTVNRAAAAPVRLSRRHLAAGPGVRTLVVNSGCANAATGSAGDAAALTMATASAGVAGCAPEQVLVASTGTIGSVLPIDAVLSGITAAGGALRTGRDADLAAATAIMTTDTVPKLASSSESGVTVGGIAKGAGMVRPDMATMIVALTTDAVVTPDQLDTSLRAAVDDSFHALNIDGCPSTNDTVVALASGASGAALAHEQLTKMMTAVCRDLARQLAADAEGAVRVVTIDVAGASDATQARDLGRWIADSALVRSAFHGGDPNWGRIVGALGATPAPVDLDAVRIAFAGVTVADNGVAADFDEPALVASLASGDFTVTVDLNGGPGRASILTTDLTPDYVRFNADRS
jgi:glutamate N-acetyltransferase / amino-acid N-acetyltransferase